jgi:predicted Zn-dependent protease
MMAAGRAATALASATVDDPAIEALFEHVAAALGTELAAGERYTAWFEAEVSDFVRMNRGKVRQAGRVRQQSVGVRLIRGARHAEHTLSLSGDAAADARAAVNALRGLRVALPELADDPHLLLPDTVHCTRSVRAGRLPPPDDVVQRVLDLARGEDFVGFFASGPMYRGFANSDGQRNWHAVATFCLDWSLYHRADKAVKSLYAGCEWSDAEIAARMAGARERLALVTRAPKTIAPGRYRAWLAPSAMEEITSLLCWGGFSGRAQATRQSALSRMQDGERLDPRVTIAESIETGVAPAFQADGFTRPASVPLVVHGRHAGALVSPRTAREFGLAANGANAWEMPEALAMEGGTLPDADALAALDTGLLIGNLWYLNYSDRPACRMTGMTRFATFWVEDGRIVAPVDVMRFDDTAYRLLGSKLEALSATPELLLATESYGSRRLASSRLPGALVAEMTFTL